MRVTATSSAFLIMLSGLFFFESSYSQNRIGASREESAHAIEWISLRAGCPTSLRQIRFLEDSTALRYAVFVDSSLDTVLFVEKHVIGTKPRCWLLGIHRGKVIGSKELGFDTTTGDGHQAEGLLLRSGEQPLKYYVRWAEVAHQVSCILGSDFENGIAEPADIWLGFRFEPSVVSGSYLGENNWLSMVLEPFAFSIVPMLRIVPSVVLMGQVGYVFGNHYNDGDEFNGWEFGASLRWALMQNGFYCLLGYLDYELAGISHNFVDVSATGHGFVSVGAGLQSSSWAMLDLSILFPLNKQIGTAWDMSYPGRTHPKTIDAMVKLGITIYPWVSQTDNPTP